MSEATPRRWPAALTAAALALAVYGLTLAPDLSWANAATDGGELITASYTLGIPHPPGYSTYILLGKLSSYLPLGTVAFRYNLFSAVCAAGAAGLLAGAIGRFWQARVRPVVVVAAALAFAFSPLMWSQAVVAEVYALNALLLAAFLLVWSGRGLSTQAGLFLGLALTTHLTSILMLSAAVIGADRRRPRLALGVVLGLLPLLALPWLARGESPVIWGRAETPAGWWWLVSGQLYGANLRLPPDGARVLGLLRALALGPAALVIGRRAWGAPSAADSRPIDETTQPPVFLLAGTLGLYLLFALAYATPDAAVLLLPALLLGAVLAAPALNRLGSWSLLLPLALVVSGFPGQDLTGEAGPRAAAEAALRAAPPGAVMLAPGDRTIFTLWYFQHVEGQRPDVRLVDANLFAFDWYRVRLVARYADLRVPAADDLAAFQLDNQAARPFCAVSLTGEPPPLPAGGGSRYQTSLRCIEGTQ